MQLAPVETPSAIATSTDTADVVSPSRLFRLGHLRIEGAIDRLRPTVRGTAPDALSAVLAMRQVEAGIGAFGSVLVPSSPILQRRRAASAIDHARDALALLQHYHSDVQHLGEGPLPLDSLRPATRLMLDQTIDRLESVATIAVQAARNG